MANGMSSSPAVVASTIGKATPRVTGNLGKSSGYDQGLVLHWARDIGTNHRQSSMGGKVPFPHSAIHLPVNPGTEGRKDPLCCARDANRLFGTRPDSDGSATANELNSEMLGGFRFFQSYGCWWVGDKARSGWRATVPKAKCWQVISWEIYGA